MAFEHDLIDIQWCSDKQRLLARAAIRDVGNVFRRHSIHCGTLGAHNLTTGGHDQNLFMTDDYSSWVYV